MVPLKHIHFWNVYILGCLKGKRNDSKTILAVLLPFYFSRERVWWNLIKTSCSKLKPKYCIETYEDLSHDKLWIGVLLVEVLISSVDFFFFSTLYLFFHPLLEKSKSHAFLVKFSEIVPFSKIQLYGSFFLVVF